MNISDLLADTFRRQRLTSFDRAVSRLREPLAELEHEHELAPAVRDLARGMRAALDRYDAATRVESRLGPLEDLAIGVRAWNCLIREGITTIDELVTMSEADLLSIRNFGRLSLREVKRELDALGLELAEARRRR